MHSTNSISNTSNRYYKDRRTGSLRTDPIYAAGFLDWCYNSVPGRLLTRLLLSRRWVSALYGWVYRQPWTRMMVPGFADAMSVKVDELAKPLDTYASFNDFITRRIDPSQRPIDPDPYSCVSPADGRLLAYPRIARDQSFPIKSGTFDLPALLRDDALTDRYAGGAMAIIRLYLADYHHFHFPDAGIPRAARAIAGRYYAVTPYARRWRVPVYADNHRTITLFDSDHYGCVAMIEVGAFTVGSIQQAYTPGVRVAKGAHKGCFALGGSLIVLLFEPGTVSLDDDLCANTAAGFETYVYCGERIGRRAGALRPDES